MDQKSIRNFVITAHIDHGKSTLADRLLEITKTVEARKMHAQYLDRMSLEQERGITIKMQPVRMVWNPNHTEIPNPKSQIPKTDWSLELGDWDLSNSACTLNLIDTPGHVDFSYEVSRALAAVEGAILLVDATKGVQAQTIANLELARRQNLEIIPAINKIDLSQARAKEVKEEVAAILGCSVEDVFAISAKEGSGVEELLRATIEKVPPPAGDASAPLRALIFDSQYDDFRGIIAHVRIVDGSMRAREQISFFASKARCEVLEVGTFRPDRAAEKTLEAGEIGYIVTGLKDPSAVRIGDTITSYRTPAAAPFPGYKEPQPVVYAALFPEDADAFEPLRDALWKLRLNDAALTAVPEESHALGRGFRCGFLGTLHLEIIVERLRREFGLQLIVTHPSVAFTVVMQDGSEQVVRTPRDLSNQRKNIREPWVRLEMLVPPEELTPALRVFGETRGYVEETHTITSGRLSVRAAVPLLDVIEEFADRLKSATRGYASFSWQPIEEREGDLVRLDCIVAHETVEALAQIVPRQRADQTARRLAKQLKEALPPQLFAVAIQVASDGRVIARETIAALRKDVTAPLYGGDFTRKKKLLVKQRKGKKRLEKVGRVNIPPDVFIKLLRRQ